jgi:hypothetical protein
MPDDAKCKPSARLPDIHGDERELNGELAFLCDEATLLCVPESKFPSYAKKR